MRSAILASLLVALGAACGPASDPATPRPTPVRKVPLPPQSAGAALQVVDPPLRTSAQSLQAGTMTLGSSLGWSTYVSQGVGRRITTDAQGNSYVLGDVEFAYGPVFVSKLSPTGSVIWTHTYDGSETRAIKVDGSGYIRILAWQTSQGFSVLTKLDPATGAVVGLPVYFPLGLDGLTFDGAGNTYLSGTNGYPSSAGSGVVVYKFSPSMSYVWGAQFGGSNHDDAFEVAVDGSGNVYVQGMTSSPDLLSALNAYAGGSADAYVAKLDPTGTYLLYTRYTGTPDYDTSGGLALDASGNVYLGWTGNDSAAIYPLLPGSVQAQVGGSDDGIITKLSPSGVPIFSGRLGGSSVDGIHGVAVDSSGVITISGTTRSDDFPVTANAAFGSHGIAEDAFVLQVNASGSALSYSSFLGGSSYDDNAALALDGAKNAYITGSTSSSDFPITTGPGAPGSQSAYAAKLLYMPDTTAPACTITSPAAGATVSGTVLVTASASDNVGVARVEFLVDGVVVGTDLFPAFSASWNTADATQGTHVLSCKAYDAAGNAGTSATVTVTVNNAPVCTLAWNKTTVPSGSSATLTLTTTGTIPSGTHVYLYGTKNGATDFNGYDEGFPPYSQGFLNTFSNAGTYRRWVVLLGYDGSTVCTSNVATTTFEAPKCTAAFSKSVVAPGSSVVFSLSSVGDIPTGSISYLYGTKNGVTDEPGNGFSGPNFSTTITNTPGLAGSYVRWLVVKTSSGQKVCQSNQTSTTFQ